MDATDAETKLREIDAQITLLEIKLAKKKDEKALLEKHLNLNLKKSKSELSQQP